MCDGIHTNNVEGMHGVLKREMRRRFWQIKSKEGDTESQNKLQLVLVIENCKIGMTLNFFLNGLSVQKVVFLLKNC